MRDAYGNSYATRKKHVSIHVNFNSTKELLPHLAEHMISKLNAWVCYIR